MHCCHPPRPVTRLPLLAALTLAWLLAGCASGPASPVGNAAGRAPAAGATGASSNGAPARLSLEQANDVTLYAISLVGTPYRYGGNTPEAGFDCSGLIGHVYRLQAGLAMPRTVAALADWGQPVAGSELRSGDLAVFAPHGGVAHAGIYVGEGRFVHAPSAGGEVRLDTLDSGYWSRQPVRFRRP